MIAFNYVIFKEMLESVQYNVPTSPLWILKSEKVFHKGKYFLKVYIHQNTTILSQLKGIVFEVKHSNSISKLKCYEFQKVEVYKDENIFGCLLEMPIEYNGSDYSVNISSYFLNSEEITLNLSELTIIQLNVDQLEVEKNSYLKSEIANYSFFPMISNAYWQCKCGKVNPAHTNKCLNCSAEYSEIDRIYRKGLMETFYINYIRKNPFILDIKIDIESNLNDYYNKFEKYGVAHERILEDIKKEEITDLYLKAYPFKLDVKYNARENINQYLELMANYGINPSNIESRFNSEELDKQVNKVRLFVKKSRGKQKAFTIAIFSILAIILFMNFFGVQFIKYQIALNMYKSGEYTDSILNFEKLGNFLDSQTLKNDSQYLQATKNYDLNPIGSIKSFEELSKTNYKDSMKLFNEYTYKYAEKLFQESDFFSAIEFYQKIPNYLDSKEKVKSSRYSLAEGFLSKAKYDFALEQLKLITDYKNSSTLLKNAFRKIAFMDIVKIENIDLVQGDSGYLEFRIKCTNLTNVKYSSISVSLMIYDSSGKRIDDPYPAFPGFYTKSVLSMFFLYNVSPRAVIVDLQSETNDYSKYKIYYPYVSSYYLQDEKRIDNEFYNYLESLTFQEISLFSNYGK